MKPTRSSRCALLALCSLVMLAGCARDEGSARLPADMLVRGNGPEPESLDPHKARQDSSLNILRDVYEGLTALDANAKPVPAAAVRWSVSADGLIYRFHLRRGLKWSNGDPVTAADFVRGLRLLVDRRTGAPYAQMLAPVRHARAIVRGERALEELGVQALDAHTVEIGLEQPAPYLPGLLSHPATFPVHAASMQLSNGAYRVVEWRSGSYVLLERNPHYWRASEVAIPFVRYENTQDPATELRRYRAGELDITYTIPGQQTRWIDEHLRDQLHVAPQLGAITTASTCEPLGVRTRLRAEEPRALNQAITAGIDVQIFRASWIADYNDALSFLQLAQSDFGVNLTGYRSAEFDELLSLAATSTDAATRRNFLEAAERQLLADHAVIPLYFYVSKHLVRPRVRGFQNNVLNVQYSQGLALMSSGSHP